MATSKKCQLIRGLILCTGIVWLGPGADARIPSLSGISQASRGLSNLLARGVRLDEASIRQLLSVLNDVGITDEARDATIKGSLKMVSGDAKTAGEHLSQLELLMDQLERALEKANADLQSASGPSLDELADEGSRCQSIERLRAANLSFGEAVATVQNLPAVLSRVAKRARVIDDFLFKYARALQKILTNPVQAALLFHYIGTDAWIDALYERDRAVSLQNRVARVKKIVLSRRDDLKQRRRNFDSNMRTLIEPLARDSCGSTQRFEEAIKPEPIRQQPGRETEPVVERYVQPPPDTGSHQPIQHLCNILGTC